MDTDNRIRRTGCDRRFLSRKRLLATLIATPATVLLMGAALPTAEVIIEEQSAVIPDITQLSLDSFGNLPDSEKGVADVISLYDLSQIIDLRDMTLGLAVSGWSSKEMESLTLDKYPFISELTLTDMAELTNSYRREIGDLPLAETALATFLQHPVLAIERKLTLAQVLNKYPDVGSFKLGFLDLSKYNYKDIPSLLNIPITAIPNWEEIKPAEIAGLSQMTLHRDLETGQIDGEIVSLRAVPEEGKVKIRLENDTGLSIDWSEKPEQGLTPFNSYSTTPTLAGEKIIVSAYFSSCVLQLCRLIGPFQYVEHKEGDAVYVSATDWAEAKRNEDQAIGFLRNPAVLPYIPNERLRFYERPLIKVIAVGTGGVLTLGVFVIYKLIRNLGKNHP